MKHNITLTILGCFFSFSCLMAHSIDSDSLTLKEFIEKNYPKAEKIEKGISYHFEEKGTGSLPKVGEYVMVEFEGKRLDGTVFDKSEEDPFVFQLGYRQVIKGWDKALAFFPVGSKVKLFLAPEMAYHKAGAGKLVPPNTPVMFDIKILKVLDEAAYDEYMMALEEKERERYHQKIKEQFLQDKKDIHEYCMKNKIKSKRTRSGVSYEVKKKGTGAYPKIGDEVSVQYKGFLVNGDLFEENSEKEPFLFIVGQRRVIEGLDEAIVYFNKGAEGTIIIPSKLAYGPMAIEEEGVNIPAHSILIFEIKMLDIKTPNASTNSSDKEKKKK